MKINKLIKSLTFIDLFKIAILSSFGFTIVYLILGSLIILFGGTSPITLSGSDVGGLKGFLTLLISTPIYFILVSIMEIIILIPGLWISKKLIFQLKRVKE